jgi:hypothetical protein
MSNRTILEINHDCSRAIDRQRFEFCEALQEVLRDSSSREGWSALSRFGVTKFVTAHHSDDYHVVVNGNDYSACDSTGQSHSSVKPGQDT